MSTHLNPLHISNLSHRYVKNNIEALSNVNISMNPGEILCLVGASGCGKSTLLRLIAGLEQVQKGTISIKGALVASKLLHTPPEKRHIGLVFQDFALFPHLSIVENIKFGLNHLPKREQEKEASHMLQRVGLNQRANDMPHTLSGGQQQRVALARAIAPKPQMLLLDEPFSNLDIRLRHRMRIETLHLLKENNIPSIMVTHDPDEAMFMADRIALLHKGSIIQIGTPSDLYHYPASSLAAEFFGEVNRIEGYVENGMVRTLLGTIKANRFKDGTKVDVLIRSEAIVFSSDPLPDSIKIQVDAVHMLGANSLIDFYLDKEGGKIFLQGLIPSSLLQHLDLAKTYALLNQKQEGIYIF